MPQKKSTTKKTTNNSQKSKKSRPASKKSNKSKVYIPAYKAIILCCAIITICMGLLLFTTLKTPNQKLTDSVVERYQEERAEEKRTDEIPQKEKETEVEKTDTLKKE